MWRLRSQPADVRSVMDIHKRCVVCDAMSLPGDPLTREDLSDAFMMGIVIGRLLSTPEAQEKGVSAATCLCTEHVKDTNALIEEHNKLLKTMGRA
jgi:hypothetical protein